MNQTAERTSATQEAMVDAVLSASRVLVAIAARSLADAGEDVTLTQYRSLVVLASRGPQSMAALAEAVAVTPATASRMCDRLVKKGLVRRRHELAGSAERIGGLGAGTGVSLVKLSGDSPLSGKTLRQAGLPKGLLVTSISRGDRVFVPNGDTQLMEGDQLSVLGQPGDVEDLGSAEPLRPPSHVDNGAATALEQ